MTTTMQKLISGVGCLAIASAMSSAGVVTLGTTFGFTDLETSYDVSTGEYLAISSPITSGDVTRHDLFAPLTAAFGAGEIGVGNDASVLFRMNITNTFGTGADGVNGRILIRDLDGDTLSGTFDGTWSLIGGFGFFDGLIDFAVFNSAGNGVFEGTGSGSEFNVPTDTLSGAISFLIQMPEWFDTTNGFDGRTSQGDGILLTPTPGSLSLLGLGGLVATRRRRS